MKNYSDEYICTQFGEENANYLNAIVPPIYMTSLHTFNNVEDHLNFNEDSGKFIYGRVSNPTVDLLEKKIAKLERGAEARCFSSGMAAITSAMLSCLNANDHLICIKNVYGPAKTFIDNYLTKFNINCTYVKGNKISDFEEAIRPNTKLIYIESPSSVMMTLQDIKGVSDLSKKYNIKTAIDNTFCTPIYQKPLELGIDMSIHTLSKYMGGHADLIGGVIVCKDEHLMKKISSNERELLGGIMGPMEAWLVLRGLRTLPVRLKQHVESSMKIAEFLESHSKVEKVYYTGLKSHPQYDLVKKQMMASTGLMSFTLKCSVDETKAFVNRLKLFKIGVSWGGFESLATMPYLKYTKDQLEFYGGENKIVRICIGLDKCENLIEDLSQSLEKIM